MIGIYKITSPSKRVYIGQSVNIVKRFKDYNNLYNCKSQTKLYRSLLKYTPSKHKFEILIECDLFDLNDKERYYQDLYSAINKSGLNCRLTKSSDRSGHLSQETKNKLSASKKGIKKDELFKEKRSVLMTGSLNCMYDKKHSLVSKLKMSNSRNPNKDLLGVSWVKERNKYLAQIRVFGSNIKINLGRYDCHLKAHLVYMSALNNISLFNGNIKEFKELINASNTSI